MTQRKTCMYFNSVFFNKNSNVYVLNNSVYNDELKLVDMGANSCLLLLLLLPKVHLGIDLGYMQLQISKIILLEIMYETIHLLFSIPLDNTVEGTNPSILLTYIKVRSIPCPNARVI